VSIVTQIYAFRCTVNSNNKGVEGVVVVEAAVVVEVAAAVEVGAAEVRFFSFIF
jgi:hypothetical protein